MLEVHGNSIFGEIVGVCCCMMFVDGPTSSVQLYAKSKICQIGDSNDKGRTMMVYLHLLE